MEPTAAIQTHDLTAPAQEFAAALADAQARKDFERAAQLWDEFMAKHGLGVLHEAEQLASWKRDGNADAVKAHRERSLDARAGAAFAVAAEKF